MRRRVEVKGLGMRSLGYKSLGVRSLGKMTSRLGRRRQKKYFATDLQHIYQRTVDGGVMFYCNEDRLVFFSIFCHYVKRFGVQLAGLCLMNTHFHALVKCRSRKMMAKLVQCSTSLYARVSNSRVDRTGAVFRASYRWSSKMGEKAERTSLAYLYNNPVEKQLCARAEEYRWNFLAYARDLFPFSLRISKCKSSHRLRDAIAFFDYWRENNKYLNYRILEQVLKGLSKEETSQITDYIIESFNIVDYQYLNDLFGNYESMLLAFLSNTGSEYDIKEDRDQQSDLPYLEMEEMLPSLNLFGRMRRFHKMKVQQLGRLYNYFLDNTRAGPFHIQSFLHWWDEIPSELQPVN